MIAESIKEGFRLANRNLQLVLIRIVVTVINVLSVVIFLGLPLIAAVAYLGFDFAHAKELLPFAVENPFEVLSRYLGLLIAIVAALFLYLVFSSMLLLYSFSGMIGTLRNSALTKDYMFSLSSFFKEAGRNFFRLFRLMFLVFSGIAGLVLFLLLTGGISALMMRSLSGPESAMEAFLTNFLLFFISIISITVVVVAVILAFYSIIVAVVTNSAALESVKKAYAFIKEKPRAILFCLMLIAGFILANAAFLSIQIPIHFLPFMTPLVYILNAFGQSYFIIVLWSSLLSYYLKSAEIPIEYAGYGI